MSKPETKNQKPKGQILKEIRQSKSIELETVHEATKIPLDVLRAIEEGYTVRTLSSFYFKAFKKKYAEYLGVNIKEIVEDYEPEKLPKHIGTVAEDETPPINIDEILPRDRQKQAVSIIAVIIVFFLLGRVVGCIRHGRSSSTAKRTEKVSKATEKSTDTPQVKLKKTAVPKPVPEKKSPAARPAAQAGAVASVPAQSDKVKLTVKALNKVWLQVKVDGNVVFQSTLNKGVTETWVAKKEVEISGKNIHYLDFEVNGKVLGSLGRADRKARRVVITGDGLTVKR